MAEILDVLAELAEARFELRAARSEGRPDAGYRLDILRLTNDLLPEVKFANRVDDECDECAIVKQ